MPAEAKNWWTEIATISGELWADVERADALQSDKLPYSRRAFVRAVFALIEGTNHAIRMVALHHRGRGSIDEQDRLLLQQVKLSIDEAGHLPYV